MLVFNITYMMNDDKKTRLDLLKSQATQLKQEVDYYNSLQAGLKLVLNGSYF